MKTTARDRGSIMARLAGVLIVLMLAGPVLAQTVPALTVNGSTAALTVVPGATVSVSVQNGPGGSLDCVGLYPAGLPDLANGSYLDVSYMNGSKTAPATGLTSAALSFPMPTPGTYEFRWWKDCATMLVKSQVVTVSTVVSTQLGPTLTVVPGPPVTATVTIKDGPGQPKDWAGLFVVGEPDNSKWKDWVRLNGTRITPTVGLTSATVTFKIPPTGGPWEVRFLSSNAGVYTILATAPMIPPPVVVPPPVVPPVVVPPVVPPVAADPPGLFIIWAGTGKGTLNGTWTLTPGQTVSVIMIPTPDPGSTFTGWSGEPRCGPNQFTITGQERMVCTATFSLP